MLKITNTSKNQINIGSHILKTGETISLNSYEINDIINKKINSLLNLNFIKIFDYPDIDINNEPKIEEYQPPIVDKVKVEKPKPKSNKKK